MHLLMETSLTTNGQNENINIRKMETNLTVGMDFKNVPRFSLKLNWC